MNPAGYELMMKKTEFNANGFQKNYLNCYDVISDEPYYPNLSERLFEETYHFQCQPVEFEFVFTDGKLVRQEKEYYEYGQNTVTALKEIELYSERDSRNSVILLSPGDEILVTGGDLSEWVQLKKVSTGKQDGLR